MVLDSASFLIAIAAGAAGLMMTLFVNWLGARGDKFLLSWCLGVAIEVAGVAMLVLPAFRAETMLVSLVLLLAGFALIYLGSHQFRRGAVSLRPAFLAFVAAATPTAFAFALGFSGLGTAFANLGCAGILVLVAREYWIGRREAPLVMLTKASLFLAVAVSFVLCAAVLIAAGNFVLATRPMNWAEDINSFLVIIGLAGTGALALTLSQLRTSRAAATDPLTGLLNRRGITDLMGDDALGPDAALVMFDLDRFKAINDRFGHAVGDDVLRRFADVMRRNVGAAGEVARLGGEEFCVVFGNSSQQAATAIAERIVADLRASDRLSADFGPPTVSAGVAIPMPTASFETLLREADHALYRAKESGRDRVQGPMPRLVA